MVSRSSSLSLCSIIICLVDLYLIITACFSDEKILKMCSLSLKKLFMLLTIKCLLLFHQTLNNDRFIYIQITVQDNINFWVPDKKNYIKLYKIIHLLK